MKIHDHDHDDSDDEDEDNYDDVKRNHSIVPRRVFSVGSAEQSWQQKEHGKTIRRIVKEAN